MGLIKFIQNHNRNVALKEQAEAMQEQARQMARSASIAEKHHSGYVKQLEDENKVLKERVAYLESLIKDRL